MRRLTVAGFVVPEAIPADDGRDVIDGLVVQSWLDGRPPQSDDDWTAVAAVLQRLHAMTVGHVQRPDCAAVSDLVIARRSVDADLDAVPVWVEDRVAEIFAACAAVPLAVIHGDPGPSNIRIAPDGRVGLIDWDESRADHVWHDLSNLRVRVLNGVDHARAEQLSHAWEAVNAWVAEPDYAHSRFGQLD